MAVIRAFRGVRAAPEFVTRVACPPYDTLSTAEARSMAAGNTYSFLHVDKPEIGFPEDIDPYSAAVYERGRTELARLIEGGAMIQDDSPCLYPIRQTMNGRSQTGLLALASVDEYDRGIIKKHEHTRPVKVNDRANHIIGCQAQASSVLTTFHPHAEIEHLLAQLTAETPLLDFVSADDNVRQEFWVVRDPEAIDAMITAFAKLDALYIADGHHRSEAASEVCRRARETNPDLPADAPERFFLNGIFPASELAILPYNRVLRDMNGLSVAALLEGVGSKFEVEVLSDHDGTPPPHAAFDMYAEGRWYRLSARAGSFPDDDPVRSIDAAILGDNLIAPRLGIENPRTDSRIEFVGGIRGTRELVRLVESGEFALAFSLAATRIEQLLRVADSGAVMPPKSTWFEPKLKSGLVVHRLDSQ